MIVQAKTIEDFPSDVLRAAGHAIRYRCNFGTIRKLITVASITVENGQLTRVFTGFRQITLFRSPEGTRAKVRNC